MFRTILVSRNEREIPRNESERNAGKYENKPRKGWAALLD